MFHKECVEFPLKIKHPTYSLLSLQVYSPHKDRYYVVKYISMAYYCPTYDFNMHLLCAMKPINTVINHPKRHPHPLIFFPKQNSLVCYVCGLIKKLIPTYICVRCFFVVHQDCIYFPYVIKTSRHHHRVSFISSLPSGNWPCGVCRQKVDNNYGAYSCNKCDDYFVHSRCALSKDLWDGKELEGVPEEAEIVDEPFKRIDDGIILHFSHPGHHLKLKIHQLYDVHKFCQACVLPVYYYSCMYECDFILHEACANAPRTKHHALYPYPLTLKVGTSESKGRFDCDACQRESCGFVYEVSIRKKSFKLDLRCPSVSEPFEYEGHEHPLFLALKPEEEEDAAVCQICQQCNDKLSYRRKLNCIECDYIICFTCVTLPYKARYTHDKHFLTFYEAKEANAHSEWCDVCESKIADSTKHGFYSCDGCCNTLHIDCLLGKTRI